MPETTPTPDSSKSAKDLEVDVVVDEVAKFAGTISEAIAQGLEVKVGHAGLYWEDDGKAHLVEKDGEDTIVNAEVDLGISGKGKLLVLCEDGIANIVRELADDESNHLPMSKTGVVVHYVTQGIARDFGITFNRQPTSLGGNRGKSASKSGRNAGKRSLRRKKRMIYLIE